MDPVIPGIHHVTAIAGDPQRNLDFYVGVMGLRFLKKTVNFDDPTTYHLYYGDDAGRPGTILTFFPWPGARKGRRGTGQTTAVSFRVPPDSLPYWEERLAEREVPFRRPAPRLGEALLSLEDPDGLRLELVADPEADDGKGFLREEGPVPPEHAIRGFHGVTLTEDGHERTASLLREVMRFEAAGEEGSLFRFRGAGAGPGTPGRSVDVLSRPGDAGGLVAVGTVHHVAFRAPDEEQQRAWREEIARAGFDVTPVRDRHYFRSIYFREPGGVLFEIATDPPGFTVDEPAAELGTGLRLPPWLEGRRQEIEAALPPLRAPRFQRAGG